jgi:hypothetical protein
MRVEEAQEWLESVLKKFSSLKQVGKSPGFKHYSVIECREWITEAGAALEAIFPAGHSIHKQWEAVLKRQGVVEVFVLMPELLGVLGGALNLVSDGRLTSLIDTIRIETEDELLDQAQNLLDAKQLAAATVLAGGALETHLRHLVDKHGLTITGDGSISKYDGVIAQARNAGSVTVYEPTDGKLVLAWGGMRNDAAHDPGAFSRSADEVRRMIEGIRAFIARTS